MATCTTVEYGPSLLVSSFHSIPHVDIDLNPSPENFELSLSYFQAVIIWACVPILCIVCLFILMAVYFICVCCCCCCQSHEKRSKVSKGICAALVIMLVVISLGMVGIAFWAEFELDKNILQSFSAARNATDIMENLRNTTTEFNYDTTGIETTLTAVRTGIINDGGADFGNASDSANTLIFVNDGLGTVLTNIQNQATPVSFGNVDPVFVTLDAFELARHWAVFAYLIVTALLLFLVALSVCCSACCKSPVCMVIMMVFFFFVTFVMWVAVGANLALLVVSGDICFAPDALIRNITSQLNLTSPIPVTPELLDYYLICNETCYPSPFQPFYDDAALAFTIINTNEGVIENYFSTTPNATLEDQFDSVVTQFSDAQTFFGEVQGLTGCSALNMQYFNVLSDLCTRGYLFSVILFAMACGVAVFMVLILMCGSFYAGLLSERREYDDETVVYDFPSSGASPWDSYGTQQQYTANRGESFPLRESPQPLGGGPEPPKYTDLSQGPGYNNNNIRYSNGAQFASDGTVDVAIRPASGGDIDLGDSLD